MDVDDLPDDYYVVAMKNGKGFWLPKQAGIGLLKWIDTLDTGDELRSFGCTDLAGSSVVVMAGAIDDVYWSTPESRKLDKELLDRDYPDKSF